MTGSLGFVPRRDHIPTQLGQKNFDRTRDHGVLSICHKCLHQVAKRVGGDEPRQLSVALQPEDSLCVVAEQSLPIDNTIETPALPAMVAARPSIIACVWDDVIVTTTPTNLISKKKKSIGLDNGTRLQGFRVDGILLETKDLKKDDIMRWAIRQGKSGARNLNKLRMAEHIVDWKAEHDHQVASGSAVIRNPETGSIVKLNSKRFINVCFGDVIRPRLAQRGRTLTKKQLDDKTQLDQELFIDIIKEYNRDAEEYNLHAFSWIQDFQDASSFVQYREENWPKAKKKFGDLMKEYEYMYNSKTQSGFHGDFSEVMESIKDSADPNCTNPSILYLHGHLLQNEKLFDRCLSLLPSDAFSESTSGAPIMKQKKCNTAGGKGRVSGRGGGGGGRKSRSTVGEESAALSSISVKNVILAHKTATDLNTTTMKEIQEQQRFKRELGKELADYCGGGRTGKTEAKERISQYKKQNGYEDAMESDFEPDENYVESQESLIEELISCDHNIKELKVQKLDNKKLVASSLFDISNISGDSKQEQPKAKHKRSNNRARSNEKGNNQEDAWNEYDNNHGMNHANNAGLL